MGTHPSCPSYIKTDNYTTTVSLKDHLKGVELPFLFKVLSVRTALSIQAHPDISLAQKLHASDPKNYRDANHKPEMAIALGDFEALCGFRRARRIGEFGEMFEGFAELIGMDNVKSLKEAHDDLSEKEAVKAAFSKLMSSSKEEIISAIQKFIDSPHTDNNNKDALNLFNRLNQQYPNDVGVFCVFFLNHFTLKSGEAVFLAANEPHAYLSGSCIECMASSDNVVRAGLTPKHRDVDVLCSMLTYNSFNGLEDILTTPLSLKTSLNRPNAHLYKSPVPEFSVVRIELIGHDSKDICEDASKFGMSILICTEGSAKLEITETTENFDIEFGSIVYLPAACKFILTSKSVKSIIYQAFEPI